MVKEEIHTICEKYGIINYTINPDGSIDVYGNVYLFNMNLDKLPLKFNKVGGYFGCSNNNLTSLEGCPKEVGDDFYCSNNKLTSLEDCPKFVGRNFYCNINPLESLEGLNININRLKCDNKDKLIRKTKLIQIQNL